MYAKKSNVLEIIYSDQKTHFQGVDTIMISNFVTEHAINSEMDPFLQALFQYIDQLSLPETPYMTGRPPAFQCLSLFAIPSKQKRYFGRFFYELHVLARSPQPK